MIKKLNEKLTIELQAGLSGWSVDLYEWKIYGGREVNQIFFSENEHVARGFFLGYVTGFEQRNV